MMDKLTLLLLISTLLLFWKIAGFTCFTAGLVRSRNTNDILAKNIVLLSLSLVLFIPISRHIIFGSGFNAYIPSFSGRMTLPTSSHAFLLFDLLMAVIPLCIITGATAERLRFWPCVFFSIFFLCISYPIMVFWVWGNGFLNQVGFIDYGGAAILHVSGAVAALAALLYLGVRQGRYDSNQKILSQPGANIPFAMLGAMQIWIGSIGVNIGSVLLNAPAGLLTNSLALVALNTLMAGATGLLTTLIITRIIYGTIDVTLLFNGALAGIVAISANPLIASLNIVMLIGGIAGVLAVLALMACNRLKIDDPIGAIPVHGVGGLWGIMAVSFSLNYLPKSNHVDFAFQNLQQWGIQTLGIVSIIAWIFVSSLIMWSIIRFTIGLRVKTADEFKGMDIITCGMNAYPEFIIPGQEK